MTAPIIDAFQQRPGDTPSPDDGVLSDLASMLKEHGVEQAVLIQPEPSFGESESALALASKLDWIGAVVVWADLASPDVDNALGKLTRHPKFRGVCLPADRESENRWLLREDVMRGIRAVARRGMTLDLLVEPRNLPSVAELAKEFPELRIVIDHLGSPFIARGIREPWGVHMLNIARYHNVWCKVSGLVTRDVGPGWRVNHIKGFVEAVVRMFGYERLMFGSDWPVRTAVATYDQVVQVALEAAGPFTPAQQERFLRGSAREFYRLP